MSSDNSSTPDLPNKDSPSISTGFCLSDKGTVDITAIFHLVKETYYNLHSIQKAVAGLREQLQDFRVEHSEDNAEVRRQLSELRRNKVWIARERV